MVCFGYCPSRLKIALLLDYHFGDAYISSMFEILINLKQHSDIVIAKV